MARKAETGIEYFPMNTDIVHNPKVKLVVAEFGPKAWAVLVPLFCKIYREKGYWLDWMDDDSKLLFAQDETKCDLSFVNEVVSGCIRRGLFDKTVFDLFGILTADRIQGNYFEAKKRNKEVVFIDEFIIKSNEVDISGENVNIITLNVDILSKKVSIGTQKKNESKIIEEEGEGEGEGDNANALPLTPGKKNLKLNNETSSRQSELKKLYSILQSNLMNKPKAEVWEEIKKWIIEQKPEFIEPFVDTWNLFADTYKLQTVEQITTKRKNKFSTRMREPAFDFFNILKFIKNSPFMKGDNNRGWKVDFNFIIESEDNYVKILEDKYQ